MSGDPAYLKSARHLAQRVFMDILRPGDTAVDATLGTGQDCVRLCELVGDAGKVYGFDVQQAALDRTRARLQEHHLEQRAALYLAGHERMADFVSKGLRLVAFNLGWLPGSDKQLTTRVETTLRAVEAALQLLADFGVAVLCVYPGHPEGAREEAALQAYAAGLPPRRYTALWQQFQNGGPGAPKCLVIEKLPSPAQGTVDV